MIKTPMRKQAEAKKMLRDIKWIARPILAGISLTYWAITFWSTGELPPHFLTGLVSVAWGWVFVSREKEKLNAQNTLKNV